MNGYDYPLHFFVAYKERQSRLTTFFRFILAIPWLIWLEIWSIAYLIVVVMAWFVLLFTAKWPAELFNFAVKFLRFQSRIHVWLFLLTDKWPSWGGKPDPAYGVTYEADALPRYSRPKAGFRMILALPLVILGYGVQYYAMIFLFLAWWAILFTGRMPRWCYKPLADSTAWLQRVNAYTSLVVQTWPQFVGNVALPGVPTEVAAAPAPTPEAPPTGAPPPPA